MVAHGVRRLSSWLVWGALVIAVGALTKIAAAATVDAPEHVDFSRDIIPLLTRAGCNSGACHGAAAGRGYLRLSLFGSRPRDDFESLVHSMRGGFVDIARPDDSWILLKPTEQMEHGGGARLDESSRAFKVLRSWIEQNAAPGELRPVGNIRLLPSEQLVIRRGGNQEVSVAAKLLGSRRTNMMPADAIAVVGAAESTGVSDSSPVSFVRRGEKLLFTGHKVGYWPVTIRVGAVAKSLAVWVSPENVVGPTKQTLGATKIDDIAARQAALLGMEQANLCSPTELARRLWIDLLQRHPTNMEWQDASETIAQGNLSSLVDQLLSAPEFSEAAAERISGWLYQSSVAKQPPSTVELERAIAARLKSDDNLQQLFRDMLTVPGTEPADPLTVFHRLAADPRERTELVATSLMGVQMGCAKCHDHPLDKWTQDDYFAMAACWAPVHVDAKVRRIDGRTTTDLRTEQAAVAVLPGGLPIAVDELTDHAFIDWLLAESNPYFARNLANRTWDWLIGGAIVTPVNDFRSTNPPVSPELLEHLCSQLHRNRYSLRALVRTIVLSDGYRRRSSRDSVELAVRLGAARRPKNIEIPIEQLASQLLGIEVDDVADNGQGSTMMAASGDSCTRSAACNDPLSEGLQLVSGPKLSGIIRRGVVNAWRRLDDKSFGMVLQDIHQRAFGIEAAPVTQASWAQLAEDYVGHNSRRKPGSSMEFPEQEVAEAIVWGWIVSDKFRSLH